MLRVGVEDDVNEHRHERIRRTVRLGMLQEAKYDLAAVEDTYYLISWSTVGLDLQ